jgi:Trp operon repressor
MGRTTYYRRKKLLEKLPKKDILDITYDLIHVFQSVKSPLEAALLLQDLLTKHEIKILAKRLRIAKLLINTKLTQEEIKNKVKVSIATVTKVNEWIKIGGDGLRNAIANLPERYDIPDKLPYGPIEYHLPRALLTLVQYSYYQKQQKEIGSLEKFWENIEDKRLLDKQLQQIFAETYKKRVENTRHDK